jgi:hypothetical protein
MSSHNSTHLDGFRISQSSSYGLDDDYAQQILNHNLRSATTMKNLKDRLSNLKAPQDTPQTIVSTPTYSPATQQTTPYEHPQQYQAQNTLVTSSSQYPQALEKQAKRYAPSSKRSKRKNRFQWMDYSLSFVLLVISVALGFNVAFQYRDQNAVAAEPEIAGITEDSLINGENSFSEGAITQEEFEAWMNEHYPDQAGIEPVENEQAQTPPESVLELFGAESIEDINRVDLDRANINSQISTFQRKDDIIELNNKINEYIATYRSYEPFDNQLETPLTGMSYIAVSEQTGMPLKYMLAIARAESRFGTDRFTASGNLTRPGQHNNACSIGLDDEGGNITFATWEEGLIACGEWYEYFESRGVPDCRKWGIFNPNGDYCSKIETLAAEIDLYLSN